jgi:3-oxoacyl-[acyl-carrier protein] reductase
MVLNPATNLPFIFLDFDQIQVGEEYFLEHAISHSDVKSFADLTGDFNPVHLDSEFALQTQFGKPIVHGMLSASYISTVIGMLIPGPGALWLTQSIDFISPAFIGDVIKICAKVKSKSPSTRILGLNIEVQNQNGISLIKGESTVRMLQLSSKKKEYKMNEKNAILITGGSRGIGAATAKKIAAMGYPTVVNFKNSKKEASDLIDQITENGGKAISIQGDISNEQDVAHIFSQAEAKFGFIESVVHCAAPTPIPRPFLDESWGNQVLHLDVQLKGAFNCAKRALPFMIQRGIGNFVFIGSIYGDSLPPTQQSSYISSKTALAGFARTLAVEFGPKGIRVNTVAPGMTQTQMIAHLPEKVRMLAKMNTPLRKLADSEDIADAIIFLIGPTARHITGITLPVCGGLSM